MSNTFACFVVAVAVCSMTGCGDDTAPASGGNGGGGGGDGGADTGEGGAPLTAQTYCEAVAAHDTECVTVGQITTANCRRDMVTRCLFGGMRPDVGEQIEQCMLDRPCEDNFILYERCTLDPGNQSPAAGQAQFNAACTNKLFECGTFEDALCQINYLEASVFTDLNACVATDDCFSIQDCLDGVLDTVCP